MSVSAGVRSTGRLNWMFWIAGWFGLGFLGVEFILQTPDSHLLRLVIFAVVYLPATPLFIWAATRYWQKSIASGTLD